jgi:hypothetical protein
MPSLPELQRLFFGALHGEPASALMEAVVPSGPLSAAARLDIYRGMYFWRLRGALAEDFPKLEKVLGEEPFSDLARAYLLAHPSGHPSLRHLGGALPGFLAGRRVACDPLWLADLAALEWARVEAFDAPDAPAISADDVRRVPAEAWPALRFQLVPCVRLLASDWPVHEPWSEPGGPTPSPSPTAIRVWRQAGDVRHTAMDDLERPAFARLAAGGTFADVCAALADAAGPDAPCQAGALLARWLQDDLIADVFHRPP